MDLPLLKLYQQQNRPGSRFIIGIGGGHREYDIINTRYVVEGRCAEATLTEKDKTLSDAMEDIISDEFTDLTAKKEEPKMKPKPVRSTAGKER